MTHLPPSHHQPVCTVHLSHSHIHYASVHPWIHHCEGSLPLSPSCLPSVCSVHLSHPSIYRASVHHLEESVPLSLPDTLPSINPLWTMHLSHSPILPSSCVNPSLWRICPFLHQCMCTMHLYHSSVHHASVHRPSLLRVCPFLSPSIDLPCEGRPGMSPPCLESQGCHLIPLCYPLSCSSA